MPDLGGSLVIAAKELVAENPLLPKAVTYKSAMAEDVDVEMRLGSCRRSFYRFSL